jgi:hypothetical protein
MAFLPWMRVDNLLWWWSVNPLVLSECSSAASVLAVCRARMNNPWALGVLHILSRALVAIIYIISRYLEGSIISFHGLMHPLL